MINEDQQFVRVGLDKSTIRINIESCEGFQAPDPTILVIDLYPSKLKSTSFVPQYVFLPKCWFISTYCNKQVDEKLKLQIISRFYSWVN